MPSEQETDEREGELERFAFDRALYAARWTEFWNTFEPDFGFVDYFEAAVTRNLSLLRGFEELADDVDRRGILPQTDTPQTQLITDGGRVENESEADRCPVCGRQITVGPSDVEYGHERGKGDTGNTERCPRRPDCVDPGRDGPDHDDWCLPGGEPA